MQETGKLWYIRCWWLYPQVRLFWSSVCRTITEITSCHLQEWPEEFLLNLWKEGNVPAQKKQIASTLLSLAKTEIASKWKSTTSPTLIAWFDRIWDCFLMSKNPDKILRETIPSFNSRLKENWFQVLSNMATHKIVSLRFLDKSFLSF